MVSTHTWKDKAECKANPILFDRIMFGANESIRTVDDKNRLVQAKRICITCPVRQECLEDAMEQERYLGSIERHGVRGGLTATERMDLASQDRLCARCRTATVEEPSNNNRKKRLCVSCQISIQNDALIRYFPDL